MKISRVYISMMLNMMVTIKFGIFDRESGMVLSEPSRFISEIEDGLLEKFILTEEDVDEGTEE